MVESNKFSLLRFFAVLLLLFGCFTSVFAQRMIKVTGTVYNTANPRHKVPFTHAAVMVYGCKTVAEGEDIKAKIDSLGELTLITDNITEIDKNGYYEILVPDNGAIVFKPDMGKCVIERVNNRMQIDVGIDDGNPLDQVTVTGIRKEIMPEPKNSRLVGNRFFPFNIFVIPSHNGNSYSRLIIQPYVLDCNSGDTIAFCKPLVYDGKEFHRTQDRMMGYDLKRDPLAKFVNPLPLSTERMDIEWSDTVLVKDPNGTFSCYADFCIEEYGGISYRKTHQVNTCMNKRPMRFLEYSFMYKNLDFDDYKETPQVEKRNTADKVSLTFAVNSDRLTDTPENHLKLEQIREKLKAIVNEPGAMLREFHVNGVASPEGRYTSNLRLAERRMKRIQNEITSILPRSVLARVYQNPQARVASWSEVVELLKRNGHVAEAEEVQSCMDRVPNNFDRQSNIMKSLPFYRELIIPCLEELRQVEYLCQYDIYREPTDEEVLADYHAYGLEHDYTRYEYWRLFQSLTDDKELELLAKKAYEVSLEQNNPWILAGNILAAQYLKRDTFDTRILEPFIDRSVSRVNFERRNVNTGRLEIINPDAVIVNQLCMYIKAGDFEQASIMVKILPDLKEYELMKAYALALGGYFQGGNTPEEKERAKQTFDVVKNSSPRNKVIMYLALETRLGDMQAEKALEDLPQNEALTWYLKATVAARKGEAGFNDAIQALSACFKLDESFIVIAQNDGEFDKDIVDTALDMYKF